LQQRQPQQSPPSGSLLGHEMIKSYKRYLAQANGTVVSCFGRLSRERNGLRKGWLTVARPSRNQNNTVDAPKGAGEDDRGRLSPGAAAAGRAEVSN
jgi:hypothetical protein